MSAEENNKKLELLKKLVDQYFTDMDKFPAEDTMFTIDEILDDQDILKHAHLYEADIVNPDDERDFDVCMG